MWTLPYFIISLFSAYLFCSFPYPSPFHNSSCLVFLISKKKGKGEIRERGWIKKSAIFFATCFVSPSPLFISLPFFSWLFPLKLCSFHRSSPLLFPFSSPVPLYMTNTQERKNKRGMEAPFLSSPVAMNKEKSIGDKEAN